MTFGKPNKVLIALMVLIVVGFLIRALFPEMWAPPLNRDEAAIGYNAYSLLLTGKDEHGASWPLAFKSIGDYKMPGYIYLTIIPVKLFGLSVFAVRFWSIVSGTLAILAMFFITKNLVKPFERYLKADLIALIAAFLLTINPWHIHYSRIGFEANTNLTLFLFGLVFLLWGIRNAWWWVGTAAAFMFMFFMYSSTYIFLPPFLIIITIAVYCFKKTNLKHIWQPLIIAFSVFLIGTAIAALGVLSVSEAKQSITVFSDPKTIDEFNHIRATTQIRQPLLAKVWYNKPFYLGRIVAGNYLQNLAPAFLFFNSAKHPWHTIPGQGFFYYIDGIFFIVGFFLLGFFVRRKVSKDVYFTVIVLGFWLFLAPLASAITIDAPHATRSLYIIPVFLIITALGIGWSVKWLATKLLFDPRLTILLVLTIYIPSFFKYFYQYVGVYPYHYDPFLFSGIKPVITYIENVKQNYPVYFSDVDASPYLYVLFYGKVDPAIVQNQSRWTPPDTARLTNIEQIDSYYFVHKMPDVKDKAYWVLRPDKPNPPGFSLDQEFSSPRTGKIEWKVYKNM